MGMYYRNAFLTIAASSTEDVNRPFLKARTRISVIKAASESSKRKHFYLLWPGVDYNEMHVHELPFENEDGSSSTLHVRRIPEVSGTSITANLPLASRGWTWQENILSTRIVHFTDSETIFECRSQQRFENGAVLQSNAGLTYRFSNSQDDMEHFWKSMVYDYSNRQLTYQSDRLPAMSGVAAEIQNRTNSRYLAGLWYDWLQSDLLWSTLWEVGKAPEPKGPQEMPSWSWASIRSRVSFEFDFCEQSKKGTTIRIESFDCEPKGLNPFGDVRPRSSITIRGLVFDATVVSNNILEWQTYRLLLNGEEFGRGMVYLKMDTIISGVDVLNEKGVLTHTARRVSSSEALTTKPLKASVQCLHVGGGHYTSHSKHLGHMFKAHWFHQYYLILGALPHQEGQIRSFSRIGFLRVDDRRPVGKRATITLY